MNQSPKRPKSRRPVPKPKDERTKFDKWLERMRDDRSPIAMFFSTPPTPDAWRNEDGGKTFIVNVIDVDRYNLLLEFPEGDCWWIAKSVIVGAAPAVEVE